MNSKHLDPCPRHIAIFGGGRWARVLIETVCSIVPKKTVISIYSAKNAKAMSTWVLEKKFKQSVYIYSDFSELNIHKINVSIIVNAARDHELIIEKNLRAGIPVLVEKPVTLSYASTSRLVKLANIKSVLFASAHVFLFARYLYNFSFIVDNSREVKSIYVNWTDPKLESRYGENKLYDQGLPVFYDLLPHILSIISRFTTNASITDINLGFYKGGSHIEVQCMLGDIFCSLKLIRNGSVRRREFEVVTDQVLKLDFSKEPGFIHKGDNIICSDKKWDIDKRPAEQMLSAFLTQAVTGNIDNRLNIEIALRANKLIDSVSNYYNQSLLSWLKTSLPLQILVDIDLQYALREIIFFKGNFPINVDMCIENIKQAFSGQDAEKWQNQLLDSNKPFDVIRSSAQIKAN